MWIKAAWDSGPYSYYYPAQKGDLEAFEADEELYKRYCETEKAFETAKDNLQSAFEMHWGVAR